MRKLSLFFLLWVGVFFSTLAQNEIRSYNARGEAQGVIRVKFTESATAQLQTATPTSKSTARLGIASFDAVAQQFQGHDLKRLFPEDSKYEHKLRKHGLHLWYELTYDASTDVQNVIAALNNVAEVDLSEPILEKRIIGGEGEAKVLSKTEIAKIQATQSGMNDPLLDKQWHYFNTSDNETIRPDASINLDKAWEEVTGTPNVVISIHDAGVDITHEDLINNLWVNQGEVDGVDGVDNDGNGYANDLHGYNFAGNTSVITPMEHGTHVAGTVAATNNNGVGVAGVAGGSGNNDGVRLMVCQILSENGGGNIENSYVYAANNGAVISQNSWGYLNPNYYEQSVLDAIDYFIAEAGDFEGSPMKGGVVIFAAGNDNVSEPYYPARHEPVIAVGSTGADRTKAYYSNYGDWIDISAPGGETIETLSLGVLSTLPQNEYGYMQGTSMACPHVAGIAGLVTSKLGGPEFSQDVLKSHLLNAAVSLEDTEPNFAPVLGRGLIDASIAIRENEGVGPDAVTGIEVLAKSNDFIELSWTVPADADDEKASKYIIYLSEGTFNEGTAAQYTTFSTGDVGTAVTYRIEGLKSETDFQLAIKAFDHWGNASVLSEVLSISTNQGPEMELSTTYISLSGNINDGTEFSKEFEISNTNDAYLEWSLETRQTDYYVSPYSTITTGVSAQNSIQPLSLNRVIPFEEIRNEDREPLYNFEEEYLSYTNGFVAKYVVGHEDLSLSNITASAFLVEDPNGFNLTELDVYLNEIKEGQAVYEVYRGPQLGQAELVFSTEIEEKIQKSHIVNLDNDESVFFPTGDVLWLVVKVPAGNLYPIGISESNGHKDAANYQWMSFDGGKSFMPIDIALGQSGFSFTLGAKTDAEYQGDYLSLTPYEGIINGEGSQTVQLTADISKLKNGNVRSNIIVKSNDPKAQDKRITTYVGVSGHESDLSVPGIANFGSVQIGREKDLIIKMENYGYGSFKGTIAYDGLDGSDFEIIAKPNVVLPRAIEDLVIRYAPSATGNNNVVLTITDGRGAEHKINLFGNGESPSEISIAPLNQTHLLTIGESKSSSVVIENTGDFPLEFNIPKYSKNSITDHEFGYAWKLRTDDFRWEELDGQEGTVDVTNHFKDNGYLDFVTVPLTFKFPFYTELVDTLYMSHIGLVALDTKDPVNGSWGKLLGASFTSNGYFAPWYDYFNLKASTKLLYKVFDDHVVFEYKNVYSKEQIGESGDTLTFQLAIFHDGHAEMRYLEISESNALSVFPMVGMESPDKKDGIYFYDLQGQPELLFKDQWQNVWIDITYPGPEIITNLSQTSGVVGVGESVEITFDVKTDELIEGMNTQNIAIENNDPFNSIAHFTVNVDITDGGEAIVKTTDNIIDFGKLFQGDDQFRLINFINEGNKNIDIVSATFSDGSLLSVDKNSFELPARLGSIVRLDLVTSEVGEVRDVLTFTDELGEKYEFEILATIAKSPAIELEYTTNNFQLLTGESDEMQVTVSNVDGDTTLRMLVHSNAWLYPKEEEMVVSSTEIPSFDYFYKDNDAQLQGMDDPNAPSFKWIDIVSKDGEKLEFDESIMAGEITFKKPVSFYGKTYEKAYMGYPGVITFTRPDGFLTPIINEFIPKEDHFNNFIAVMWGITGFDYFDENPAKGIYFYEDENKAVFTYHRWVHSFGEGRDSMIDAQVILYHDGRIKMQYKTYNQPVVDTWNNGLVIGLENEDGTEGVLASYGKHLVKNNLVLEYIPSEVINVEPGEEKVLDFVVDTKDMDGGVYNTNLTFLNHTPGKENISIPVTLEVIGQPEFVWENDVLDLGDIQYAPNLFVQPEFTFKNLGTGTLYFEKEGFNGIEGLNFELYFQLIVEETGGEEGFGATFYGLDWIYKWKEVCEGSYHPLLGCMGEFKIIEGEYHYVLPQLRPQEEYTGRVTIRPQEAGEYEKVISYTVNGVDHEMTIKANFFEPPVFESDVTDTLSVMAMNMDHTETQTFEISNENGKSALEYQFDIEYNYTGETALNNMSAYAANSLLVMPEIAPFASVGSSIDHGDFAQAMYYGDIDGSKHTSLGYGGGQSLTSVTRFEAPGNGIDLSHVATWYVPTGAKDGNIIVEVLTGTKEQMLSLHRETFSTVSDASDQNGEFQLFELSETLTFFPGENIFIAFTYDQFSAYPQGMKSLDQPIPNTFFIPTNTGLVDMSEDSRFETLGFMVRGFGKDAVTGIWFSLDQMNGSINPGEKETITASFAAAYNRGRNDLLAKVNINTNDPSVSEDASSFMAKMNINHAPQAIETPSLIKMNEGDTATVTLSFTDMEGHAFTLAVEDLNDLGTFEIVDTEVNLTITPSYDHAGTHSFNVIAEDEHGMTSTTELSVEVANVNRAPEGVEFDTLRLSVGEVFYLEDSEVFSDPDGDVLTFGIADNNDGVVLTGHANAEFIISAIKEGITEVAVLATDPEDATAIQIIPVVVTAGGDDVTNVVTDQVGQLYELFNYPNPVQSNTILSFNLPQQSEVEIAIFSTEGRKVDHLSLGTLPVGHQKVDYNTDKLQSGVYIYTLIVDGQAKVFSRLIK
ncbi:S8 family serine peptidase [Flammeovirga sp. MY04]|uniref:S8 family serine peptidase n=1 Tax=Flammeovirga sp. MY04 TaxID=1191459 RepID=UPI0008060C25|nr:S8 family serine peptidase [Flammeovirga sp. MY04]ANQ51510.1 S8 family serine peptidase [Flammeovirga sp. MY04]